MNVRRMIIKVFGVLLLVYFVTLSTTSTKAAASNRWMGSFNIRPTNSGNKNYSSWSTHAKLVSEIASATSLTSLEQAGRPKINDLCKYSPKSYNFIMEGRYNLDEAMPDCEEGRVITTGKNVTKEEYDKDGAIYQTIVYDTNKYKYVDSSIYYFNLRTAYDKDIKYNRGHIWAKFEYLGDSRHKQIMFLSAHLSPGRGDKSKVAIRKQQMNKIVSRLKAYAPDNKNIVLAGDFNINYKLKSDRTYIDKLVKIGFTCNSGDKTTGYEKYGQPATRLVDYVCYNNHLKGAAASVKTKVDPQIYTGTVNGVKQMASDHLYVRRLVDFGKLK